MASLSGLPNELLLMICDVLHPAKDFSHGSLGGLTALARTNKRLSSAINPLLYDRGIQCHAHLPLLWAAKVGEPGTLPKALAAGADTNHTVRTRVSQKLWSLANDTLEASREWANDEPSYWSPLNQARAASLNDRDARWARDMTPTMTEFDVYAATSSVGAPHGSGNGVDQQYDYESSSESGSESELDDKAPPRGLDLGARVPREYTALHIAAKEGHDDIISILLDCGADAPGPRSAFAELRPAVASSCAQQHLLVSGQSRPPHPSISLRVSSSLPYLISISANFSTPARRQSPKIGSISYLGFAAQA
jgi:hypothetical protein